MSYSVFAIQQSPAAALKAIKKDPGYKAVPKHIRAELEAMLSHYAAKNFQSVDVQCYGQEPHLAGEDPGAGANAHLQINIHQAAP